MENYEWLKELKEGSPIILKTRQYGRNDYLITSVASVTPTGRVRVFTQSKSGIFEFYSDGRERGADTWSNKYRTLIPYSAEMEQQINEDYEWAGLARHMGNYDWAKCNIDQLRRIDAILSEGGGQ